MPRSSEEERLFARLDFTRADRRLELMEEWARGALRDKRDMAVIRPKPPTPPPMLLPSRWRGVLYGPDGKRME